MLVSVGCGTKTGTVSGKVTYNKVNRLPGGMIIFFASDGEIVRSKIAEDGTYTATNVPVGSVRVAVAARRPPLRGLARFHRSPFPKAEEAKAAPAEETEKKYVTLPARYTNPDTSHLTLTVEPRDQKFDVDLKGIKE
jgi:hypothetical protein